MSDIKPDGYIRITSDGSIQGTRIVTETGEDLYIAALNVRFDCADPSPVMADLRIFCRRLAVVAKVGTVTTACLCCGAERTEGAK